MTDLLITDVRPWGGQACDVAVADGRITAIGPDLTVPSDVPVVAGAGRILVPTFADVHVHLDSTLLGEPFRPHTGAPGIAAMVANDRRHWREAATPLPDRTTDTLGRMIANGTTKVRSYANVDPDARLERLEAVCAARAAHADRCDVEIMAFPQSGLLREPGVPELMHAALRAGASVVGGIDPCQLDRDPVRHLDIVFGLAERHGVDVDIHLHEPAQLALFSADLICERTAALGMQGRVTISHGYTLGEAGAESAALFERFAELDIAMATVAPARATPYPLEALVAAGVRVGLGEDGQRDLWSPYGNADMLYRTYQLAFTSGFRRDDLFELCWAVATAGGRSVLDAAAPRVVAPTDKPGLAVGDEASLLLVAGETLTATLVDRTFDANLDSRTVLHRGRVVAEAGRLR